jgi:hypothetical protein
VKVRVRSAACLLAAAVMMPIGAAGQRIEVPDAPWGATRADVARTFEGLGFRVLPDTAGLAGFTTTFGRGGTEFVAIFGQNGLAMLNRSERLPRAEAQRRFTVLRDSLVGVLGQPDSARRTMWVRPDGRIQLHVRSDSGRPTSLAILNRSGPNYRNDLLTVYLATRSAIRIRPAAWLTPRLDVARWEPLFADTATAISVERASVQRLEEAGAWRVTVRWDWRAPRPNGQRTYDALVHATEVRCGEGTYRMGAAQWFLGETASEAAGEGWGRWNQPVANSGGWVIVRDFCDYAQRLRQPESTSAP